MYNLGTSPLGDTTYQISKLYALLVSEKKIFKDFAIFFILVAMATRVMIGIQSLEHYFGRASPEYQSSALSSFREEEYNYLSFPSLFLCFELVTPLPPPPGQGQF